MAGRKRLVSHPEKGKGKGWRSVVPGAEGGMAIMMSFQGWGAKVRG